MPTDNLNSEHDSKCHRTRAGLRVSRRQDKEGDAERETSWYEVQSNFLLSYQTEYS